MRRGGFRFFFYSNEGTEPPHVHVERQGAVAKFWLSPPSPVHTMGMSKADLRRAARLVERNRGYFEEVWHEFFGT